MIPVFRASVTVLCVLASVAPVATAPEHSVSTSRQFLVYGPDMGLRGALCDLAERTKHDFLQVIDQKDGWATPVLIHAQYPRANLPEMPRANLSLSQTGFGLKFQLDLILASDVTQLEIQRALLGAVLLEMMYRGLPNLPAGAAYVSPPAWLLDGLQSQAVVEAPFAAAAAHGVPALEEFLRQRPDLLDAPGRSLYSALSVALVALLTHMPDGRHRLACFIADLPAASDDPTADLRMHFPELVDPNGSAKEAWKSCIAQLAAGQSGPLLNGEESDRILTEMLRLTIPEAGSEKKYHLDEFARFIRNSAARSALARLSRVLTAYAARADMSYHPVIYEYAKIATRLARGKTRGIAERLAHLTTLRKAIASQLRKIVDYMNWFEATKSPEPSGAFGDYMKAAELASQPGQRRRDPISVYLDVLETQFED